MDKQLQAFTHTGILVSDLDVEFGASGRMVHKVTVPKGTACIKLDGGHDNWVVNDLSFIEDKKGFLFSDADLYGIRVPEGSIGDVAETNECSVRSMDAPRG